MAKSIIKGTKPDRSKDEAVENGPAQTRGVGKLLKSLTGKKVRLTFFDEEADIDLYDTPCLIME